MMKIFRGLFIFCLFALAAGQGGCGYTTSSALPGGYRTIYIQPFKNNINFTDESRRNIYLPLLEVNVRTAIVDRFQFDGNLRIAEESRADLVLVGELVNYQRIPLRFTDNDDVQEYRVQIAVNLMMKDTAKKEAFWTEDNFVGEATYFVSGPKVSSEDSAVRAATLDLARRVVERTIENW